MRHTTVPLVIALAVVALAAAGCGDGARRGAAPTLSDEQLEAHDLEVFWTNRFPVNEDTGETVEALYVEPDRVYAVTNEHELMAMDAFSGTFLWSYQLPEKLRPTAVTQRGEATFVAALNRLFVINNESGALIREIQLNRAPSTRLVVEGNYLYYGTSEGWFMAYNLADPVQNWNRLTHAAIIGAPASDGRQVYYGNNQGDFFASDYNRRNEHWQYKAGDAISADIRISSRGLVLVPSRDYSLYAMNPTNGSPAWICTTGDPILVTPYLVGDRIYVIKSDDVVLALDEVDGERPLWTVEGVSEFVAADRNTLFVRTPGGDILALDPTDGSEKFNIAGDQFDLIARNETGGSIIAATRSGHVVNIRTAVRPGEQPEAGEPAEPLMDEEPLIR